MQDSLHIAYVHRCLNIGATFIKFISENKAQGRTEESHLDSSPETAVLPDPLDEDEASRLPVLRGIDAHVRIGCLSVIQRLRELRYAALACHGEHEIIGVVALCGRGFR